MAFLHTSFGIVPIEGTVDNKDMPALERAAIAWARERREDGYEEIPPLLVSEARMMPAWQKLGKPITYSSRGIV